MDSVEQLVSSWRAENVALGSPASNAAISQLETALAATLPEDLVRFYSLANGMRDSEWDRHMMSFWSIEKALSENERQQGRDAIGEFADLAIADFLINSWFVWLRVRAGKVVVFVEGSQEEFDSFATFATCYIESPDLLSI